MDSAQSPPWTSLALLLRPQGRKGEILADLLFDSPERFTAYPAVFLAPPGFGGFLADARPAEVVTFWLPSGRNRGRIVLHFAGVDSISQAEALAGLEVFIPKSDRLPLEDDSEYVEDLIGCTVFDGETEIGTLESLEFSTASDGKRHPDVAPLLTVVTGGGDEVLIPYVSQFLLSVDIAARQIRMNLPPGLIDLNLPQSSSQTTS